MLFLGCLSFWYGSWTLQTMKEFFDEMLVAIPDYVLDKPIGEPPSGSEDPFANIQSLLPPAYESRELELQYA